MKFKTGLYLPMLLALLVGAPAALYADSKAADAETLARQIEGELIAPCCWRQTIAEHRSEASEQMRREIRGMIGNGMSHQQIIDFYIGKYGERILAAPRPRGFNLTAYILPGVALLVGAFIVTVLVRRWRYPLSPVQSSPGPADAAYLARIEREMEEEK